MNVFHISLTLIVILSILPSLDASLGHLLGGLDDVLGNLHGGGGGYSDDSSHHKSGYKHKSNGLSHLSLLSLTSFNLTLVCSLKGGSCVSSSSCTAGIAKFICDSSGTVCCISTSNILNLLLLSKLLKKHKGGGGGGYGDSHSHSQGHDAGGYSHSEDGDDHHHGSSRELKPVDTAAAGARVGTGSTVGGGTAGDIIGLQQVAPAIPALVQTDTDDLGLGR